LFCFGADLVRGKPKRQHLVGLLAEFRWPATILLGVRDSVTGRPLPYQSQEFSGSTASGPQQATGSAWVGIASAPGSALTIWEWE
jgi:hypothetical protein